MRDKLIAAVILFLAGCYPINKTLQPNSVVKVVDHTGQPISEATVTLVSNAYPYGFEKTRMVVATDSLGEAYFPGIREWRTETLMIHGFESYFWNWCIVKAGYKSYYTGNRSSDDFEDNFTVTLEKGVSSECPEVGARY